MNIDEIALRVWYANNTCMPADGMNKLKEFAHALLAELSKDAEPVASICSGWQILFIGSNPIAELVRKHDLKIGDGLFTYPYPVIASEQRVAEACAKYVHRNVGVLEDVDTVIAGMNSGKWGEYL